MRDLNRVISVKEAAWVSPGLPWAEEEEGGQGRTQEGSRGQVSIDNLSIHHILIWSAAFDQFIVMLTSYTHRTVRGMKAKLLNKKRYSEKVQMKKTIKAHQEKKTKGLSVMIIIIPGLFL